MINRRHRMTLPPLFKAFLVLLGGVAPGATLGAAGACDEVLTPSPGVAIPSDTRVAGRRFGGISGIDFDPLGRQLVYHSLLLLITMLLFRCLGGQCFQYNRLIA